MAIKIATPNGDAKKAEAENGKIQLKREVGLIEAVALIVGGIIGSGIFISPKGVYEFVGSVGMSLVIWAICGLISLSGALTFTELGTSMPSSGGAYFYLYEVFGPIPAFLYLWVHVWILAPSGNAIVGLAFASYVSQAVFPIGCHIPEEALSLIAAVVICFLTFLNCYDVKSTVMLQNVFLVAKMVPLAFIKIAGLLTLFLGDGENFHNISFENTDLNPGLTSLALYICFYSYSGWQIIYSVTEELKDPNKNMPRAIYISLPLITAIYMLANVAYFCVLSPQEMLASDAVAVSFVEKLFGRFGWIMSTFVAISTFGAISAYVMGTSRQLFVGARTGQFPEVLSHISISRLTPTPSIIFLGALSICYLFVSDMFTLINYASYVLNITNLGIVAAFFYLRVRKPDMPRPIKVSLIHPLIFTVATLFLAIFPIIARPFEVAFGVIIGLSGLPVYFLFFDHSRKGNASTNRSWTVLDSISSSLTRLIQKLCLCLPEDRS